MQSWLDDEGPEIIPDTQNGEEIETISLPKSREQTQKREKRDIAKGGTVPSQYGVYATKRTKRTTKRGLNMKPMGSPKAYKMSKLSNNSRSRARQAAAKHTPERRVVEEENKDDFSQWVHNNKKLTSALQTRTAATRAKGTYGRSTGTVPKRSHGHLRNNFVTKKRGTGFRSRTKAVDPSSPSSPKHSSTTPAGWNDRIQRGIPKYDAKKDKHCKVRKKRTGSLSTRRVRTKKKTPYTSKRHGSTGTRRRTTTSKLTSSYGSTHRTRRRASPLKKPVKQAWAEEPQQYVDEATAKKIESLEFQLMQSQTESVRVIELKEHTIKQLRLEKYSKEKLLEKLKSKNTELTNRLHGVQATLEKREKRLRQLASGGRRQKGSREDGPADIRETVKKQKLEIRELEGELNMFKTQNRMLRANEQQDRNSREDARDELIKLRKRIRIEQERVRKLKEKLTTTEKASTRIEKLTKYLEREKRDATKAKEQLQKLEVAYQGVRAELADANARMAQLSGEQNTTQTRMQNKQDQLDKQRAKVEQLEADKKSLRDQIVKLERNTNATTKSTNALNRHIQEKEEDLKRVARHVSRLEKDKSDLESKFASQGEALQRARTETAELKQQFDTLKNLNKNSIESARSDSEAERRKLEQRLEKKYNDNLKSASRSHTEEISQLKQQHDAALQSAASKQNTLASKIKEVTERLTSVNADNKTLKAKLADQSASLMLQKQVEELQQKLKESNERCSVLSESNALLLMRLKREEAK